MRELSRVAVPETEREWLLAARGKTAREVERMVSGLAPGDRPADRRRPERLRHILRFEVGAETLATFREAMRELRKRSDHRLDDDAALLLMAREVLGGPGDAGRASYQVVVTQCEDCGRGFQHANGDLIELDPAIVEIVTATHKTSRSLTGTVSPPMRRMVPWPMLANSQRPAPTRVSPTNSPAPTPTWVSPTNSAAPTRVSPTNTPALTRVVERVWLQLD